MVTITFFDLESLREELEERGIKEVRIADFYTTKTGKLGYCYPVYIAISARDPKDGTIIYRLELVDVIHQLEFKDKHELIKEKTEKRLKEIHQIFKGFTIKKGMYSEILKYEKL